MNIINIEINCEMFEKVIGRQKGFDKEAYEKIWNDMIPTAPRLDPVDLVSSK